VRSRRNRWRNQFSSGSRSNIGNASALEKRIPWLIFDGGEASPTLLADAVNPAMFSTGCWTTAAGYRLTAAGSMATTECYRKQVELLLVWAVATTNPDLKAKLLARALEFLALVDCVDDGMLRGFQQLFAEFNAQLLHKP
jgi:hypothetical protein